MKEKLLLAAALLGFATACNNEEDQPKVVGGYVRGPVQQLQDQGGKDRQGRTADQGHRGRSNAYLPTPEATTAADGTYDLSGKGVGNTARVTLTTGDGRRPTAAATSPQRPSTSNSPRPNARPKGDGDWDQGAFAKSGVDIALEEKE